MNFKYLILLGLSIFLVSCASVKTKNDLVGIYKVTYSDCKGNAYEKSSCNEIQLLEIVNGKFYKIEDHECAFVVWSGNVELNFSARKLIDFTGSSSFPFEFLIDQDNSYVERLVFNSRDTGKYEFGKPSSLSTISFEKAKQEEVAKYVKEYPGNE